VFNENVFEVTACVGPSMLPTFNRFGDIVLVDRRIDVGKGDVVVSRSPTNPKHMVCKRVVAVGGERVEKKASASDVSNHRQRREDSEELFLDGEGWSGYRKWDEINKKTKKNKEYVTVPDGHVWLQGDNEGNSTDSRDYGAVPMEMLRGRVFAKVWPMRERGWVERDERYALRDEKE
jgi:signal peptidase I